MFLFLHFVSLGETRKQDFIDIEFVLERHLFCIFVYASDCLYKFLSRTIVIGVLRLSTTVAWN